MGLEILSVWSCNVEPHLYHLRDRLRSVVSGMCVEQLGMCFDSVCSHAKQCKQYWHTNIFPQYLVLPRSRRERSRTRTKWCTSVSSSVSSNRLTRCFCCLRRDVEQDGLAFVESYHVDGNVFVQTFKLNDVADGQWKRQTGGIEFGEMGSIMAHAWLVLFGFDAVNMCQNGVQKAQLVVAVLYVDYTFLCGDVRRRRYATRSLHGSKRSQRNAKVDNIIDLPLRPESVECLDRM